MTKLSKRIPRAKKTRKAISTVEKAIKAYGGVHATAKAFGTSVKSIRQWHKWGVPCTHHLGLYLGLQMRGRSPAPATTPIAS